jgi:hypothetical protein
MEMLANRYEALPRLLHRTLAQVSERTDLRAAVTVLRRRGWLDWHILTALANLRGNERLRAAGLDRLNDPEERRRLGEAGFAPEGDGDHDLPTRRTTPDHLDQMRRVALPALVRNWGLELRDPVVDLDALERVLAARYAYWSDDLAHEDPFQGVASPA